MSPRSAKGLGLGVLLLGFAFLYLPILLLMFYSFNSSRLAMVWAGFSTRAYSDLFADRALTGEAARAALFKENPILSSTRAAKDGRVMELDPTLLVGGLGPRLPDALKKISDGFYPGTAAQ